MSQYQPIENYGLIGDMHTAALVGINGSIDWITGSARTKASGRCGAAGQQHFVYSKLMCWVAIDRGLRLAEKRSFPADRERWIKVRDHIYEEIMSKGWNDSRAAFVQYYDSDSLDAANLIMPLVFCVSPTDPRMLQTLKETLKPPH